MGWRPVAWSAYPLCEYRLTQVSPARICSVFTLLLAFRAHPSDVVNDIEQKSEPDLREEILVWGRATELVGVANSASDGIVGYGDLLTRPILRVGEMVEVIPGMIATQHSGGGKANQYFLRGINLDHGTDFSILFEGMPVNMRTHAHGQGYLDMNFIIPELIESIQYRKGTHSPDSGDFSAAGSSLFNTYDRLDAGFTEITIGSEDFYRVVAANSWTQEYGDLLLGTEVRRSDGPWENPEEIRLFNGLAKLTGSFDDLDVRLIATYYRNDWNATDQIPRRAVDAGVLPRFGFIDPSVGGKTHRFNLIGQLANDSTTWQAFASQYTLDLYSNPTYFLGDPVNGDQIEQQDDRWIFGGRVEHLSELHSFKRPAALRFGADLRFDAVNDVNLNSTAFRQRLVTIRNDKVKELSVGAYLSLEYEWTEKLRTVAGLRADRFDWDVMAEASENSGSGSDSIVTPKFSLVYAISDDFEIYANYGAGFHSNDARTAETRVDPLTGQLTEPFDVISEATGFEAGFRAHPSDRFNVSATLFFLELESELIFVGDAGTTEPNDATERVGVELALFWRPTDWIVVDLSAAKTDAKFRDLPAGADSIPNATDFIAAAGAAISLDSGLVSSIRLRHFGGAPLVEDSSVRKKSTTLVNAGLSYSFGDWQLGLDVMNVFDTEANDIEYLYESRLFDEMAAVEDRHFHPVQPRELRLRVRRQI